MADFNQAFPITANTEGGISNNPDDTGGYTAFGISENNWPDWQGWSLIKANPHLTLADPTLRALVEQFYKQNFWNPLLLDQFVDQQIANAVYDFGVNAGIGRSAKFLQGSLNALGATLTVDGQIGQHTINELNAYPPDAVLTQFNNLRTSFYHTLAQKPGQGQFLASWLSRIKPYQS
jgi:lysozyme family protein